ncbi:MAG: RsiV family protein [Bacteroidales bacterium]|nr:RsiV family protein [Bacteroidales bacterium]
MRKFILIAAYALAAVLLSSCTGSGSRIATRNYSYADSTKYAEVHLSIDLPITKSEVADSIKYRLLDLLQGSLQQYGRSYEDTTYVPYPGDLKDAQGFVKYYGENIFERSNALSKADDDQRVEYIMNSADFSDEERQFALDNVYTWQYDVTLYETEQTDKYIVFSSSDYVYMGGAHGGVTGLGSLTFSKETGKQIESFLLPESLFALQPYMKRGLMEYFADEEAFASESEMMENLFIEGDEIPMPAFNPFPSKEGLVFVYQQYEIASYASGMPSFTLPYDVVRPYLTEEAESIL